MKQKVTFTLGGECSAPATGEKLGERAPWGRRSGADVGRDRALMTGGTAGMEPVVAKASQSASSFSTLFFVSFPDLSMFVSYTYINALKFDLIKSIS